MSFNMPKNVPSFTSSQRDLEDKVWAAAFGQKKDLPMYKDKPYYTRSQGINSRRRMMRRKRVFFGLGVLLALAWWVGLFSGGMGGKRSGEVDWEERRQEVKKVMQESWKAYETDAWGFDVYHPRSKSGENMVPGGLGWIIVDALDTLMLMNLTTELAHARDWVEHSLNYDINREVNTFETTIRMLGGLLSAHYLQEDLKLVPDALDPKRDPDLYLNKAVDLANRLLGAYDSPSGIPYASVNLQTNAGKVSHADGGASSTAEATTLQVEMKYITKLTGELNFWEKAEKVIKVLDDNKAQDGLVPIFISPTTGHFTDPEIRLGSRGDSYYEYLLKQYLQTGQAETVYADMYHEAVAGIRKHLVAKSHPSHLTYIGELPKGIRGSDSLSPKMDHLVCFIPGMLALGATGGLPIPVARKDPKYSTRNEEDLHLAKELMHTCYNMYAVTKTGLAPEIVYFNTEHPEPREEDVMDPSQDIIIKPRDAHNLQRPETVESLFVMWRITGDEMYREWGWKIFQAFVNHTKVETGGYTSLESVMDIPVRQRDNMESFWLAETLKYFYLLFSPDDILPLDKIVFNTEAHPLPVFELGSRFKTGWKRLSREIETEVPKEEKTKQMREKKPVKQANDEDDEGDENEDVEEAGDADSEATRTALLEMGKKRQQLQQKKEALRKPKDKRE
ncbi:family 47 glycosyl hydrolase [Ascodesmis nigricans]|uniref:alpha-1,2-Mannosidase n=1 Tax=Ascodesmis nigricans TaxID=341454 RepID=A0A4S2N5C8_9PEZI|nr:family 47 glycosyl hydrolase [Ascodesmis nigricans]